MGVDIFREILPGRGETDLNHTVRLGMMFGPTSVAIGSWGDITREVTNPDIRGVALERVLVLFFHWKKSDGSWQVHVRQ